MALLTTFLYLLTSIGLAIATFVVYNLYLHPLAKYPGPWKWRAFRFTMLNSMLQGNLPHDIARLHREYGAVVRTAPNELSFIDPQAWKDIYSRRDWHRPLPWRSKPPGETADSVIQADGPTHARQRKALGPAFTDVAVADYETYVNKHVDLLFLKLRELGRADVVMWLTFCLFDITTDIGWATSFNLLGNGGYHPWVTVTMGFKDLILGTTLAYYEPLGTLATMLMPKSIRESIAMVLGIARTNVKNRLNMQMDRKDIFSYTMGAHGTLSGSGLTEDEMVANSMNYTIAGSDSVSTVLVGAVNYLVASPRVYNTLIAEIRNAFTCDEQITDRSAKRLPYLNAVLKEAMRLCPTVPDGMRREVPPQGATVCGLDLPGGTVVSFHPLAAYTSETLFNKPLEFLPERWLSEPVAREGNGLCAKDFPNDRPDAFEPFSYGPRGCIGRNLAWMELRVILARLVFDFDVKAVEGERRSWHDQKIYWIWEKEPLEVELTPRA